MDAVKDETEEKPEVPAEPLLPSARRLHNRPRPGKTLGRHAGFLSRNLLCRASRVG